VCAGGLRVFGRNELLAVKAGAGSAWLIEKSCCCGETRCGGDMHRSASRLLFSTGPKPGRKPGG